MLKSTRLFFFVLVGLRLGGAMAHTSVFPATPTSADKDHRPDEQAIELVKRSYESGIAHDGTTLASLFLPGAADPHRYAGSE